MMKCLNNSSYPNADPPPLPLALTATGSSLKTASWERDDGVATLALRRIGRTTLENGYIPDYEQAHVNLATL